MEVTQKAGQGTKMSKVFDYVPIFPLTPARFKTKDNFEVQLVESEEDWRECHVFRRYRITNLDEASPFQTYFYAVSIDPRKAFCEFCEQTDCVVFDSKHIERLEEEGETARVDFDFSTDLFKPDKKHAPKQYTYKVTETNEIFYSAHVNILQGYKEFKQR